MTVCTPTLARRQGSIADMTGLLDKAGLLEATARLSRRTQGEVAGQKSAAIHLLIQLVPPLSPTHR